MLRLVLDVILPEARLAVIDREHKWLLRIRRHVLQLSAFGLFLSSLLFLGFSFINNYSNIDDIHANFSNFVRIRGEKHKILNERDTLAELRPIANAAHIYNPEKDSILFYRLGLYQGNDFYNASNRVYSETLNKRLLPLVREDAAVRVRKAGTNLSELREALRAYLMLCQPEHINKKFLMSWLQNMWSELFPGDASTQQQLYTHMEYLIEHGLEEGIPHKPLVDNARNILLKISPAELAYLRLKEEAIGSANLPHTLRSIFTSQESPFTGDTYEIPFLYTKKGFEEYCLARSAEIIQNMVDDRWLYGPDVLNLSSVDVQRLYKGLRALYFRDYANHWNTALNNLRIRKPATLAESNKLAELYTSGISPVVLVLSDLRANLDLLVEPSAPVIDKADTGKIFQRLGRFGKAVSETLLNEYAEAQRAHFLDMQKDIQSLRQSFVNLDGLLEEDGKLKPYLVAAQEETAKVGQYYLKFSSGDMRDEKIFAALISIASEKDETLRGLEIAANRLPVPVQNWYLELMYDGLEEMISMAAQYINMEYVERVLTAYNNEIRYYYPCAKSAERDVNLESFTLFFGPNGTLESFYNNYLKFFVASNGSFRPIMGKMMPFSKQSILQWQMARKVQNAFFTTTGELNINLGIEVQAMDVNLKRVNMSIGPTNFSYWHGPVQNIDINWPFKRSDPSQAAMQTTNLQGIVSNTSATGHWALFRIFQKAHISKQEGNNFLFRFDVNKSWIDLKVQSRNKVNSLDPSLFAFVLPDSF